MTEEEQHMLICGSVFEKKEWSAFNDALPDLNDISCFGVTESGSPDSSNPKITASFNLFYTHGTTILHKALWNCADRSTIQAILLKNKEDPLKRNLCTVCTPEEKFYPLHLAAGACDDIDTFKDLIEANPLQVFAEDDDGLTPQQILSRGGRIEGQPPRVNTDAIMRLLISARTLAKCNNCNKRFGPAVSLRKCGACKAVAYCKTDCQRADWKAHKTHCKKITSK
jgi:hypothetical protein